jgi:hypothetical protein
MDVFSVDETSSKIVWNILILNLLVTYSLLYAW